MHGVVVKQEDLLSSSDSFSECLHVHKIVRNTTEVYDLPHAKHTGESAEDIRKRESEAYPQLFTNGYLQIMVNKIKDRPILCDLLKSFGYKELLSLIEQTRMKKRIHIQAKSSSIGSTAAAASSFAKGDTEGGLSMIQEGQTLTLDKPEPFEMLGNTVYKVWLKSDKHYVLFLCLRNSASTSEDLLLLVPGYGVFQMNDMTKSVKKHVTDFCDPFQTPGSTPALIVFAALSAPRIAKAYGMAGDSVVVDFSGIVLDFHELLTFRTHEDTLHNSLPLKRELVGEDSV